MMIFFPTSYLTMYVCVCRWCGPHWTGAGALLPPNIAGVEPVHQQERQYGRLHRLRTAQEDEHGRAYHTDIRFVSFFFYITTYIHTHIQVHTYSTYIHTFIYIHTFKYIYAPP